MFRAILLIVCLVGFVGATNAAGASPEDHVKERAKARLEVARQGLALAVRGLEGEGAEDYDDIWVWSKRVLKAELALSTTKAERIAALEAHLKRAVKLERIAMREFDRGGFTRLSVIEAKYRRSDIETRLAEEKAKSESPHK